MLSDSDYAVALKEAGTSPEFPDHGVRWEPNNFNLPEALGLCSYNGSFLAGCRALTILHRSNLEGYDLENCSTIQTISFPNLQTLGDESSAGLLFITGCSALTEVNCPVLETIAGQLDISTAPLTSLSFPRLVTAGLGVFVVGNTGLTTVSFPALLPTNDKPVSFGGCALNAASVNHILARCVANPDYVSGTVSLHAGTNAAPTGQGLTDVTTLTDRGVTVHVTS